MSVITKSIDWWFNTTGGKCICGKKVVRNQYYCGGYCMNKAIDSTILNDMKREAVRESEDEGIGMR